MAPLCIVVLSFSVYANYSPLSPSLLYTVYSVWHLLGTCSPRSHSPTKSSHLLSSHACTTVVRQEVSIIVRFFCFFHLINMLLPDARRELQTLYLQINKSSNMSSTMHALFSANEQKGQVRKGPFPPLNSAVAPSMMSFKTPFRCLCLLSLAFLRQHGARLVAPWVGEKSCSCSCRQTADRARARVGGLGPVFDPPGPQRS